eukprot:UN20101
MYLSTEDFEHMCKYTSPFKWNWVSTLGVRSLTLQSTENIRCKVALHGVETINCIRTDPCAQETYGMAEKPTSVVSCFTYVMQ